LEYSIESVSDSPHQPSRAEKMREISVETSSSSSSSPRARFSGGLLQLLLLRGVQDKENSASGSEALGPVPVVVVVLAVVGSFEEGGGEGDGDRDGGGVDKGAGAGAGVIGSGSGCTGHCVEGGSGGSIFEESAAATARRLSQTAPNVARKQALTALLVAAPAILLPILETSDVFLALLLVLLEQRTRPNSVLKGILTISSLK
jgi:hypothetical protein